MALAKTKKPKDSHFFILLAVIISANFLIILHFILPGNGQMFNTGLLLVVPLTNVVAIVIISTRFHVDRGLPLQAVTRKAQAHLLSNTDSLFQLFTEQSTDMIHLSDQTGTILYVNPATSLLLGYRKEEMMHTPALQFVAPEDRDLVRRDMKAAGQGDKIPPRKIRLLKNDGTFLEVEAKGFALGLDNGKRYIGAILRDIASRRQNEHLAAVQADWEQTFNTITDFVSVHDQNFRIIRVNRAVCELLDKKPEEIIGQYCYRLFHNSDSPIGQCPQLKAVQAGHPVSSAINDPHIGFPLQITCSPLFAPKGEFMGSVHVARTIEDRTPAVPAAADRDFIAICASCQKIREDQASWLRVEDYVHRHYGGQFTHSICPSCQQKLYPQFADR